MAILQKHGKNSSPDLASVKDKPEDDFEGAGHQKKWPESSQNWSRWVSEWMRMRVDSQIDPFLPT